MHKATKPCMQKQLIVQGSLTSEQSNQVVRAEAAFID